MNELELELASFLKEAGVKMVKHGGPTDLSALCPFHEESRPSFSISFSPEKWGVYNCFSCGEHGDFFRLTRKLGTEMVLPKISLKMKLLAILQRKRERQQEEIPESTIKGEEQAVYYLTQQRGYEDKTARNLAKQYGLYRGIGFWSNYIIIPIRTVWGETIGFTSRCTNDRGQKTRHGAGSDKSNWLFGADVSLSEFGPEYVILVEGPFDVFRLNQYGHAATALLGPPTKHQLRLVKALFGTIYTAFDGDASGKKYEGIVRANMETTPLHLPFRKDPDDLSSREWERVWNQRKRTGLRIQLRNKLERMATA